MMDRRNLLKGALALTVAAVPGAAVAAQSEIDRLWPKVGPLVEACERARAAMLAADEDFDTRRPVRPKEAYQHPLLGTNEGWDAELQPNGTIRYYGTAERWWQAVSEVNDAGGRAQAAKRAAVVDAYERECEALEVELNLAALEDAYDAAWTALREVDEAIFAAPCTNMSDLMKKVSVARRREGKVIADDGLKLTENVFADIERLAAIH